MFGSNPRYKKDFIAFPNLVVHSTFRTVQGEGPYAGSAATFIRLSHCNLACSFCDTEFEQGAVMSPQKLLEQVKIHHSYAKLVVITGGEPLLQDMSAFCEQFFTLYPDHIIQIETAGTVWQENMRKFIVSGQVVLVCSPKTPTVKAEIKAFCKHWKYIIQKDGIDHSDGLPNIPTQPGLTKRVPLARPPEGDDIVVWLQPMDEYDADKNAANIRECAELAMLWNYKVSLQIHKLLGVE
jgi:7-carboxy-7-deazaguanine synthase